MLADEQRDALQYAISVLSQITGERAEVVRRTRALKSLLVAHNAGAQEPVAVLHDDGHWTWKGTPPYESNFARWRMDVYTHPQPMPQTDAARDAKRLDWLMQHVCCDDFPGISIDLGLSREEHYAEFRRQIDAEIERIDRAKGE